MSHSHTLGAVRMIFPLYSPNSLKSGLFDVPEEGRAGDVMLLSIQKALDLLFSRESPKRTFF